VPSRRASLLAGFWSRLRRDDVASALFLLGVVLIGAAGALAFVLLVTGGPGCPHRPAVHGHVITVRQSCPGGR
jgi:hypothetical protein